MIERPPEFSRRRFLAVVGSSGSGKSSLVRAGLLPALRDGFLMNTSEDWLFLIARPGSAPYAGLADSMCRAVRTEEGRRGRGRRTVRTPPFRHEPRRALARVPRVEITHVHPGALRLRAH